VAEWTTGKQGSDPYDLNRFLQAQANNYAQAFLEIQQGHKRSHWMWYVFPQFDGLGRSAMSQQYAIKSVAEATAYLTHPVLGVRLVQCGETVLQIQHRTAYEIFGSPDDQKLQSCATLFAAVSPAGSVFHQILDRYFQGEGDRKTLSLIESGSQS
jgi:uncharacterized protein (DUF1810 family)